MTSDFLDERQIQDQKKIKMMNEKMDSLLNRFDKQTFSYTQACNEDDELEFYFVDEHEDKNHRKLTVFEFIKELCWVAENTNDEVIVLFRINIGPFPEQFVTMSNSIHNKEFNDLQYIIGLHVTNSIVEYPRVGDFVKVDCGGNPKTVNLVEVGRDVIIKESVRIIQDFRIRHPKQ